MVGLRRSVLVLSLGVCGCIRHAEEHLPGTTGGSTAEAEAEASGAASTTGAVDPGPDTTGSTGEAPGPAEASGSGETSTGVEVAECGDGKLDPGEACDQGYGANDFEGACLPNCVQAVCGDGYVHRGAEECDDGNAVVTDGCDLGCMRTRRIFITSAAYDAGQFKGIAGADQRCRSLAAQAGLANAAKFKAWISDSTTSPSQRLFHGRGRYELVNGLLVAESWEALLAGELHFPIEVTEKGETHHTSVWTGSAPDGTAVPGSGHCLDWTSSSLLQTAFYGVSSEITADWTLADVQANPTPCNTELALYCVEQE